MKKLSFTQISNLSAGCLSLADARKLCRVVSLSCCFFASALCLAIGKSPATLKPDDAILKCVSLSSIEDVAGVYKEMWGIGDKAVIQWKLARYFECETWSGLKKEPCAGAKKIFGIDDDDSPYSGCIQSYNIHKFMKDSLSEGADYSSCKTFLRGMNIWKPSHKMGDDYICDILLKGYKSRYMPVCRIISFGLTEEDFYNHADFEYNCKMTLYPDLRLCPSARTVESKDTCLDGAAILDFLRDNKSEFCLDNSICLAVAGIKNECHKLAEEILTLYCERKLETDQKCSSWCIVKP